MEEKQLETLKQTYGFFFFLIWNASQICVSSLCRGHANLCIVSILVYVMPKWALGYFFLIGVENSLFCVCVCVCVCVYSSSVFVKCVQSYSQHYKKDMDSVLQNSYGSHPFPHFQPLGNHWAVFSPCNSTFARTSYKWNHTITFSVWLL